MALTRAGKVSQFSAKIKRSEAHKMCDRITGDHCSCRKNKTGPCKALLWHMRNSWGDGEAAAALEIQRMEYNRQSNSTILLFTGRLCANGLPISQDDTRER